MPLLVNYKEVKYTSFSDGLLTWHSPEKVLPYPFDLVLIKTDRKSIAGWWTGNKWMGLRLRKEDKIISWQKSRELDFI